MKISILVNLLNIVYDVLMLTAVGADIAMPGFVNVMRSVLGLTSTVSLSLSMIIASLYGSKTIGKGTADKDVLSELKHRYDNSDLKLESYRVMRELESIEIGHDSPLYDSFHLFYTAVRDNLLYRIDLSMTINMLVWYFLFYNSFVYLIYYYRIGAIKEFYARIIYMTLNVINPTVSLIFSYIVILCDNVNSIVIYIDKTKQLRNSPDVTTDELVMMLQEFSEKVEQPFIYQF